MSSDLLEQAMIDAAALKEAAMKNAENALIEKYSAEFNQTVQKLLEQEDMAAAGENPGSGATPPAGAAIPTEMPDLSAGAIDPMAGGLDTASQTDKAFSKVPGAFSSDDDELITINFDQIKATLNEMYDGGLNQDVTPDALAAGKSSPDVVVKIKGSKNDVVDEGSWEQEELELELEGGMGGSDDITGTSGVEELEEVELEEQNMDVSTIKAQEEVGNKERDLAAAKGKLANAQATAAKAELEKQKQALAQQSSKMEEAIELTEEELQELAEELKVDIKVGNLSDGHMGSTETQKREQRTLELAAARDDKAAKQREEELAAMKDLMRENTELKSLNNEALEAIGSLKEQVERLNVLNAKLLYTNKALANVSLNERQKSNIVESLSKADSVLAAKTIYETVQNAVEGISKEKEAPQSLRETLNRAATPFVVKKSANNSVSDLMADRMKALAGIKKLS